MRTTAVLVCLFLSFGQSLAECSAEYGAKPCAYTPAPPGKAPFCARAGNTYCEHPVHYPRHLIHYLLEKVQFNYSTLLTNESPEEFNTYYIPNKPKSTYGVPTNFDYYTSPIQKLEDSYLSPPRENQYNNSFYGYPDLVPTRVQFPYYSPRKKRQADLIQESRLKKRRRKRWILAKRPKRQSAISGVQLCETRSQFIMPRAALNHKGNWMYIVNMPELDNKYMQLVRSETCVSQQCSGLCQLPLGYSSSCQQKYLQRRLVALEESGNQLYSDNFWFPTCCVCTLFN